MKALLSVIVVSVIYQVSAYAAEAPESLSQLAPEGEYVLLNSKVKASPERLKCPMPGEFRWNNVEDDRWVFQLTSRAYVGLNLKKSNKGYFRGPGSPKAKMNPGLHTYFKATQSKKTIAEQEYTYAVSQGQKRMELIEQRSIKKLSDNVLLYSRFVKEKFKGKMTVKEQVHCPYLRLENTELASASL